MSLLKALKPYKGGNEPLWGLNRLDILDKHRLLVPVAAGHHTLFLGRSGPIRNPTADFSSFRWKMVQYFSD